MEKINMIERDDDKEGEINYGEKRSMEIEREMWKEKEIIWIEEKEDGIKKSE